MSRQPPVTAAVIGFTTLTLDLPMEMRVAVCALLAARALWLLPDWLRKWIDVRDRWHRLRHERRCDGRDHE
jgi:hypothetical protein